MAPHEELLQKIAIVRSRWKTFLWLRGLAWVLGVSVVSLVIGLALADSRSVSGWMVTGLRLALLAAIVVTVIKALVLPLRRKPTRYATGPFHRREESGIAGSSRQRR